MGVWWSGLFSIYEEGLKMIKLTSLIRENYIDYPNPELRTYIYENYVRPISGDVYHGTPPYGLLSILKDGIFGTQHGEVAEYESFSTSLNEGIMQYFSEGHGITGVSFKVSDVKCVILDDILQKLVQELPGSGLDVDVDEEEFDNFCERFNIPSARGNFYLPYDYLSGIGLDAFMYEYVWDSLRSGELAHNDESELCFIGKGINKLESSIYGIYVDGEYYDPDDEQEKLAALEHIKEISDEDS